MNRVVNKKAIYKNCSSTTEKRQKKKEKCACSPINKKGRNARNSVAKVKKVVRNVNLLNEWAENESSKPEIYEKPKIFTDLQSVPSDDSVIFIGNCTNNQLHGAIPIIDLTDSPSDSFHEKINLLHPTQLKTIYFPSRNFDRNIKLRKSMATTSLITLPVLQKYKLPKRLNSTTILSCSDKKKLDVLDIPKDYLNSPDENTDSCNFYEKSKLNGMDYRMIDWILNMERDIDISLSPTTSGYSSVDSDLSREKINSTNDKDAKDQNT